jgi:hypothetical protein
MSKMRERIGENKEWPPRGNVLLKTSGRAACSTEGRFIFARLPHQPRVATSGHRQRDLAIRVEHLLLKRSSQRVGARGLHGVIGGSHACSSARPTFSDKQTSRRRGDRSERCQEPPTMGSGNRTAATLRKRIISPPWLGPPARAAATPSTGTTRPRCLPGIRTAPRPLGAGPVPFPSTCRDAPMRPR